MTAILHTTKDAYFLALQFVITYLFPSLLALATLLHTSFLEVMLL